MSSEAVLHQQIADYIRLQYPKVIFRSDEAGNNKVSWTQRRNAHRLQSDRGYPDIFIAEPRHGYHGIFIELKRDGVILYRKDGKMVANKHYREQDEILARLVEKGYIAIFAIGFDEARQLIDDYLGNEYGKRKNTDTSAPRN